MEETKKLLPQVPVLTEYKLVKDELKLRIKKLNEITVLTEDNKKEVKSAISEINKVKDRVSRFRIDETAKFLEYINPYIDQCKELEKLCVEGVSTIKSKVTELEEAEKKQKAETVKQLFLFALEPCPYKSILSFDMFFEPSMSNKTSSLTVIENQLNEWIAARTSDLDFIKKNADEADAIIAIYLTNGLKLTAAVESHQERYRSEAEIKAMISAEAPQVSANVPKTSMSFEKKVDITVSIKQLPQSKVKALQSFLDGLGVDWEVK